MFGRKSSGSGEANGSDQNIGLPPLRMRNRFLPNETVLLEMNVTMTNVPHPEIDVPNCANFVGIITKVPKE
jgi:hypothetical protein